MEQLDRWGRPNCSCLLVDSAFGWAHLIRPADGPPCLWATGPACLGAVLGRGGRSLLPASPRLVQLGHLRGQDDAGADEGSADQCGPRRNKQNPCAVCPGDGDQQEVQDKDQREADQGSQDEQPPHEVLVLSNRDLFVRCWHGSLPTVVMSRPRAQVPFTPILALPAALLAHTASVSHGLPARRDAGGIFHGMKGMRISTTVDATSWNHARSLVAGTNSDVVDAALLSLIESLEAQREQTALAAQPYAEDPDLNWEAPAGPPLPYDASVPEDVLRLAERRRNKARKR